MKSSAAVAILSVPNNTFGAGTTFTLIANVSVFVFDPLVTNNTFWHNYLQSTKTRKIRVFYQYFVL